MNPGEAELFACFFLLRLAEDVRDPADFYLMQCIYLLALEIQLSHETVNLIFQLVLINNQLTILWGS